MQKKQHTLLLTFITCALYSTYTQSNPTNPAGSPINKEEIKKIDEPDDLYQLEEDECLDMMDLAELETHEEIVNQQDFSMPWYMILAGKVSSPFFALYNKIQNWWHARDITREAHHLYSVKKKAHETIQQF